MQKYTDEQLVNCLKAFHKETGKVPSWLDWKYLRDSAKDDSKKNAALIDSITKTVMLDRGDLPSSGTFKVRFNGWQNALIKAGLKKTRRSNTGRKRVYSNKYLLDCLKSAYRESGDHRFTVSEWQRMGRNESKAKEELSRYPSMLIYKMRFGSWEGAWEKAGLGRSKVELDRLKSFKAKIDEYVSRERERLWRLTEESGGKPQMDDPRIAEQERRKMAAEGRKTSKDPLYPLNFTLYEYTYGSKRNLSKVDILPTTPMVWAPQVAEEIGAEIVHREWLAKNLEPNLPRGDKLHWKEVLSRAGFSKVRTRIEDGDPDKLKEKLKKEVEAFLDRYGRLPKPQDLTGEERYKLPIPMSSYQTYYRAFKDEIKPTRTASSARERNYTVDKWSIIMFRLGFPP